MDYHITTPTLLLDKQICLNNIQRMRRKAEENNIILRPHFKTHQSRIIGEWFRQAGMDKITVSSVKMAWYFAHHGWDDITIAFPFNIRETEALNKLSETCKLNLLVESVETLHYLEKNLKRKAGIYIKIDTGYHRTGLVPDSPQIEHIIQKLSSSPLSFRGFLVHSGDTYHAASKKAIRDILQSSSKTLLTLKEKYCFRFKSTHISIGDTPSCSLLDTFEGIDEIRPGNFVFYDIMQKHIGACNYKDIAVCMAAPVVAKHKDRNEIVIYGGAVHLSKDFIINKEKQKVYGEVVPLANDYSWGPPLTNTYVSSLSQEHGIIKTTPEWMDCFRVGQLVGILPVHSCLTANLMKGYMTLTGEVIDHLEGQSLE